IIKIIKAYVPDLEVNMVKTPLLNQFSYLVDDSKLSATGINLNGSIKRGIKETLGLLKCVKRF
ncbi:MAG TPA: nucleoside-diphosphate sugar epimerase, partial [Balneola sp.]|nr:nucleoside-diphosphate sugar epimerase [Balneola sp.]